MSDIKLFVCCHDPAQAPEHPLLVPVQTGAALSGKRFPNFFQDDTGVNISNKNSSYCELTAHYWAWKNVDADFYGFFHYRRYLCPHMGKKPYYISRLPVQIALEKMEYGIFPEIIQKYDIILPKKENMYLSVRDHYYNAKYHYKRDLDLAEEIVRTQYPAYVKPLNAYLSGSMCYFGNIFIMKKTVFRHYCSWLFSILEAFDQQTDLAGRHPQAQRADGYLAERLLGGYAEYLRMQGRTKILELPRVLFIPERRNYCKAKVKNFLVPPGTRRRAVVKRFYSMCAGAFENSL